jgi:hypothetical protein
MTRFSIRHETRYDYDRPVRFAGRTFKGERAGKPPKQRED